MALFPSAKPEYAESALYYLFTLPRTRANGGYPDNEYLCISQEKVLRIVNYLKQSLGTTFNIVVYLATFGRLLWLEGRVRRGVFRNWARQYRYRPVNFVQPATEQEIIDLIKGAKKLRVFGSGHSFNSGVVVDGTLVSLDKYSGVVWKDVARKQFAVRGGTRIRDVNLALRNEGLAFSALPSHDAQSIAGILSTDVHGTGRDWGFVSESVVGLRIIDGKGQAIDCLPGDDLFKAAIGGVGAVGIIVEVVIEAVDRFNVEQKVSKSTFTFVEKNLEHLLEENDHMSLYMFPFTEVCLINTWNRTQRPKTFLGPLRELASTSIDALSQAWLGDLLAYSGSLPALSSFVSRLKPDTDYVLESNEAFNRTIYLVHQELEFAVPFKDTFHVYRRFLALYEEMYQSGLPLAFFELRFTPAGHTRTLVGAGRQRQSTWIDIICSAHGFEKLYSAAENLMKEIGARPHLGKSCRSFDSTSFGPLHGEHFARFRQLAEEHDPEHKFVNPFTQRLFGLGEESPG